MIDRSLPQPLFESEAWSSPREDQLIRLDWIVTSGGPFRTFHERLGENVFLGVDLSSWDDSLWTEEALRFFAGRKKSRIVLRGSRERFFELFGPANFEILTESQWRDISAGEWFQIATGVQAPKDALEELLHDVPGAQPWLNLGYLPGLVRRRDPEEGIKCARLWSRFAAWSSPQNGDKLELFDAATALYEVNPTLQIVQPLLKPGEPTYVEFFWRVNGCELREGKADSFMALVIDEIREEGPQTRDRLLEALSVHGGSLIAAALERMIDQAIVIPVGLRSQVAPTPT